MNRERLTILRDHLASLPDTAFDMRYWHGRNECGTTACIGGWTAFLFGTGDKRADGEDNDPEALLDLTPTQGGRLFIISGLRRTLEETSRADAIAAIQSMLDSPDDDALPVWPERESS